MLRATPWTAARPVLLWVNTRMPSAATTRLMFAPLATSRLSGPYLGRDAGGISRPVLLGELERRKDFRGRFPFSTSKGHDEGSGLTGSPPAPVKDEKSSLGKLGVMVKQYGPVAIVTYLGIYVTTLGCIYGIFEAGLAPIDLNGANSKEWVEKVRFHQGLDVLPINGLETSVVAC
jgi:hypothetical protein